MQTFSVMIDWMLRHLFRFNCPSLLAHVRSVSRLPSRYLYGCVQERWKVVIRNSVFNGKPQLIEGDKQSWPIYFYWKAHTVSLIRHCIIILLVKFDLHNGESLFVPLAKLGFPINYQFRKKSIVDWPMLCDLIPVENGIALIKLTVKEDTKKQSKKNNNIYGSH